MSREVLENKLKAFLTDLRLAEKTKSTISDYEHQIKIFINWFSGKEITKENLIEYKESLLDSKDIKAISSKNKNIVVVNKFVYYLGYENMKIKQFKHVQELSLDNPIYPQEHKRMLRFAKKYGYEDMYLIMKIFANTGCRCAELKYFTYENVSKTVFEIYNKGKARKIILVPELKQELIKYCKKNNITDGYIFRAVKDASKPLPSVTIWWRLKKIAGYAKINKSKIHAHSWRHLFAKEYMKLPGASESELADILGHAKLDTTRLYTRTSTREKQQRLEQLYKRKEKN